MSGKKDAIGDDEKPRLSLIPRVALWAMGKALSYGEKHYGSHNFRGGIKVTYLLDAALRHIMQYLDGEDFDEKSKCHHLGSAMANLAMALQVVQDNKELDDRFKKEDK